MDNPTPGSLSFKLSAHPITLVTFLGFRIGILPECVIKARADSTGSEPTGLPPRPPLHKQFRPHLYRHDPFTGRGLLLPEEHRRTAPCRPALVERGQCHIRRIALGV